MSPDARELYDPYAWTVADKIDAFVAACVLATGCFVGGFELRAWLDSRKPAPPPRIVYVAPLTQWTCDAQEFREHREACIARGRSSAVQPPKRKSL